MIFIHKNSFIFLALFLTSAFQSNSYADAPKLKTTAPVIYLQDNLDEEANLGWCIDTVGRGFGEKIHSHSCKPQGGDVQFDFNSQTGNIESVEYAGKCITIVDKVDAKIPFGLQDCIAEQQNQLFTYDPETLQFNPADDDLLCIAVESSSRKAGPFMSRDLVLSICEDTDPKLLQWIVKKA